MDKIKKFFTNNMNDLKKNVKEYPATYLVTIVITLLLAIIVNVDDMPDIFENIIYFAGTSIFVYWLTELLFKKWLFRIIGYVVATGAGIGWAIALDKYGSSISGVYRILIGYIVVLVCLCVYFIMKKMNVNSYKYILDVFQNIFTYSMFYAVINIGLTSVLCIFIRLILNDDASNLVYKLQILLLGWFYFPSLILAFTKEKSHITKFIKSLVKYVLYPITLIAISIIYMYMIKILIFNKFPSNSIYGIVTYIFVFGFASFIMVRNYSKDNKFYEISTKIVPWIFIPLIILQAYSIIVRTSKYGFTISRYLGIVFVIVEVVILALNIYTKKDKLDKALLIIAILAVIASVSPFNVEKVTVESQVKILVKEWPKGKKFNELTEKQKDKIADRYLYIVEQNQKYKKLYMKKYTSNKKYIVIKDMKGYFSHLDKVDFDTEFKEIYYVGKPYKNFDISKYKKAQIVEENDGDEELIGKEMIKQLIQKYGKDLEDNIENGSVLKIDDKKDLYIYSVDVYYYIDKDDIEESEEIKKDIKEESEDSKKDKDNNKKVDGNVVIDTYDIDAILLEK